MGRALQSLNLIKYWRGTHLIHADPKIIQEHLAKYQTQSFIEMDPASLHWQPLVMPTQRKKQ